MDFQLAFINALKTNTALTKAISIYPNLPISIAVPSNIKDNLPFIQAYRDITASYPYYYEISNLNSFCLLLTERGTGILHYENNTYTLNSGTITLFSCMDKHRIEIKQSPWKYKVLFIQGNPIPFLYHSYISEEDYLHTIITGSVIPDMFQKLNLHLSKEPTNTLISSKILMDILFELLIEKTRHNRCDSCIPNYLLKIKQQFDTSYQHNFNLNELEQEYNISKFRICREFKEYFELSPIQYLNSKRIEVTKEALKYTDKRINEIGRMVGFDNTNHFIRLFKQQTGVTPLVYRRQPPETTYFQ